MKAYETMYQQARKDAVLRVTREILQKRNALLWVEGVLGRRASTSPSDRFAGAPEEVNLAMRIAEAVLDDDYEAAMGLAYAAESQGAISGEMPVPTRGDVALILQDTLTKARQRMQMSQAAAYGRVDAWA